MQNPNFCLRMQSLDNSSDEVFWNGTEFISPNSEVALRCLSDSDFVSDRGVLWRSEDGVEVKFHFNGLMLLSLTPNELDEAGRIAPISITLNLMRLEKNEFLNFLQVVPDSLGRSFPSGVLNAASSEVTGLMGRSRLGLLIRYLIAKYIGHV